MFVKGYIVMSSFARWASAGSGCLLVSGLIGCVAVKSPAPFTPKSNSMLSIGENPQGAAKPQPLTLEQLVISQTTAETLGELYARGLARLERRDFVLAEGDFALCVKVQPEGPLAAFCLYYDGIANDELRRFDVALQRFVEINNRFPEHALALQASLRALRLAVHLERWSLAVTFSERVIGKRKRLKPFELVLPYGALAMDAVSRGDDNQAEQHVARARSIIEEVGLDVPGRIHRDLAVVYFALGELRRIRAGAAQLRTYAGKVRRSARGALSAHSRCAIRLFRRDASVRRALVHDGRLPSGRTVRVIACRRDEHGYSATHRDRRAPSVVRGGHAPSLRCSHPEGAAHA